jgi:hypothetical protein
VHVSQKALSALRVSRKAKDRTLKLLEERGLIDQSVPGARTSRRWCDAGVGALPISSKSDRGLSTEIKLPRRFPRLSQLEFVAIGRPPWTLVATGVRRTDAMACGPAQHSETNTLRAATSALGSNWP